MLRVTGALALAAVVDAQWTLRAANLGTISTGSAFVDGKVGYLPVAANGVGTTILTTGDGGKTWTNNVTAGPTALLLLDIAAHRDLVSGKDNVAVIGALSLEYSKDSAVTFNKSLGPLGAGQCIRNIANTAGAFAAVGTWGLVNELNGPSLSYNGGVTYKAQNISSLTTEARYGAFPTTTSWFITAGQWPGETTGTPTTPTTTPSSTEVDEAVDVTRYTPNVPVGSTLVKKQSARLHLLREPNGDLTWAWIKPGKLAQGGGRRAQGGEYVAQIATTTDGGKTWATVFSDLNEYYFNGIECASDMDCCAVAEDEGPPYTNATDVGTYIFCTVDGGKTWTENFRDQSSTASLTDIAALAPLEYWAVGAELGKIGPKDPSFYHTTDGGKTWTQGTASADLKETYAIAIDCVAGVNCWANVLDTLTQESSIAVLYDI
jgi:photosystem II stability/assembly factor-like uncharacterized protein